MCTCVRGNVRKRTNGYIYIYIYIYIERERERVLVRSSDGSNFLFD